MRSVEIAFEDELFEKREARCAVDVPQTARLRQGQTKPRHLLVLGSNACQE
jgi:hypothetical protein